MSAIISTNPAISHRGLIFLRCSRCRGLSCNKKYKYFRWRSNQKLGNRYLSCKHRILNLIKNLDQAHHSDSLTVYPGHDPIFFFLSILLSGLWTWHHILVSVTRVSIYPTLRPSSDTCRTLRQVHSLLWTPTVADCLCSLGLSQVTYQIITHV